MLTCACGVRVEYRAPRSGSASAAPGYRTGRGCGSKLCQYSQHRRADVALNIYCLLLWHLFLPSFYTVRWKERLKAIVISSVPDNEAILISVRRLNVKRRGAKIGHFAALSKYKVLRSWHNPMACIRSSQTFFPVNHVVSFLFSLEGGFCYISTVF